MKTITVTIKDLELPPMEELLGLFESLNDYLCYTDNKNVTIYIEFSQHLKYKYCISICSKASHECIYYTNFNETTEIDYNEIQERYEENLEAYILKVIR